MKAIFGCVLAALLLTVGCKREQRLFDPGPNGSQLAGSVHATVRSRRAGLGREP